MKLIFWLHRYPFNGLKQEDTLLLYDFSADYSNIQIAFEICPFSRQQNNTLIQPYSIHSLLTDQSVSLFNCLFYNTEPMTTSPNLEDSRRGQILDAAFSCFASRGFSSVTMDDIARVSGLSKGALYWYYKSKDELILALCEAWIEKNDRALMKMAQECSLDQLLFEYPKYLFAQREIAAHSKFFFHLWAISTENDEVKDRVAKMYREHNEQAGAFVRTAVDLAILKPEVDPENFARQILALFDGLLIQWHYDPTMDLSANWSQSVRNLLEGIGSTKLQIQE